MTDDGIYTILEFQLLVALAMPEKYRTADPVQSYRTYYINDKARLAKWKPPRSAPKWFNEGIEEIERRKKSKATPTSSSSAITTKSTTNTEEVVFASSKDDDNDGVSDTEADFNNEQDATKIVPEASVPSPSNSEKKIKKKEEKNRGKNEGLNTDKDEKSITKKRTIRQASANRTPKKKQRIKKEEQGHGGKVQAKVDVPLDPTFKRITRSITKKEEATLKQKKTAKK